MAIPFHLPEDEINNLIAAVIFLLSETRLQPPEDTQLQECLEELYRLLVEELQRRLRSSAYDNQLKQTLSLLRHALNQFPASTVARIPRRRTSSDSFCEDGKMSVDEADYCSQDSGRAKESVPERSWLSLSRLVPVVGRTFWTAVPFTLMCMVGWHMFQRSCM